MMTDKKIKVTSKSNIKLKNKLEKIFGLITLISLGVTALCALIGIAVDALLVIGQVLFMLPFLTAIIWFILFVSPNHIINWVISKDLISVTIETYKCKKIYKKYYSIKFNCIKKIFYVDGKIIIHYCLGDLFENKLEKMIFCNFENDGYQLYLDILDFMQSKEPENILINKVDEL